MSLVSVKSGYLKCSDSFEKMSESPDRQSPMLSNSSFDRAGSVFETLFEDDGIRTIFAEICERGINSMLAARISGTFPESASSPER